MSGKRLGSIDYGSSSRYPPAASTAGGRYANQERSQASLPMKPPGSVSVNPCNGNGPTSMAGPRHGNGPPPSMAGQWRATGPPMSMAGSKRQKVYNPQYGARPVPSQSGYGPAASTLAGTARTLQGKGDVGTSPSLYAPGKVIKTLFVTPNMNPTADINDSSIGRTHEAGPICGKLRPFVVLAVTETHLKCIPMYTATGRGFDHLIDRKKWECIYLRHWSDQSERFRDAPPSKYLMTDPKYPVKEGSYLMWTRSYDVSYEWPIDIVGGLTKPSFSRLQRMHKIGYDMGLDRLDKQVDKAKQALAHIIVNDEIRAMRALMLANQKEEEEAQGGRRTSQVALTNTNRGK